MAYCNNTPPQEVDDALLILIEKIVCLNEPINATLQKILFQPTFCDEIPACMNEEIEIRTITGIQYDVGEQQYDTDGIDYDVGDTTTQTIIKQECPSDACGEFDGDEYNDDFTNQPCTE